MHLSEFVCDCCSLIKVMNTFFNLLISTFILESRDRVFLRYVDFDYILLRISDIYSC